MKASSKENPAFGFHISFLKNNGQGAYDKAIEKDAIPVSVPKEMPWGGTVGFVRDLNRILVSFVTPRKG